MKVNPFGLWYFELNGKYHFSTPDLDFRKDFTASNTDPNSVTIADLVTS